MPIHTPSPHRFLAPNPPSAQKSQKPQSGLRNALAVQTPGPAKTAQPKPELVFKRLTPAKRFVLAPPQQTSEALKERRDQPQEDTPTRSTPLPKPQRRFERIESIEEPSQSSQSDAQNDNGESIVQSVEGGSTQLGDWLEREKDQEDDMLFGSAQTSKRRRMEMATSPSLQPSSEPSTPVPVSNATTHRFKVPPPRTPAPFPSIAAVTSTSAAASQRPHFIFPALPTSPPKPPRPLPEIFSPTRKKGKYTPNGLASTVTSWIIETANTSFAAQDRPGVIWGRDKEHGVKLRIRVTSLSTGGGQPHQGDRVDCYTGGIVFAIGNIEPGMLNASRAGNAGGEHGPTRVMLAGQGGSRASGGVLVKIGSVVGVRAPLWDVDIGEHKWTMAVDWVLLGRLDEMCHLR